MKSPLFADGQVAGQSGPVQAPSGGASGAAEPTVSTAANGSAATVVATAARTTRRPRVAAVLTAVVLRSGEPVAWPIDNSSAHGKGQARMTCHVL
ncbi:hypothetical protein [Streptomyces pyridomyceticus]|uniref:hypothetical protein n=1 Tax=Streptomyces pyridomyceticus TaxID=68260 RepID=UPI0004AB5AC3|nr:hypothetical protein [Streptomyces pyridomyceticus]